MRPTMRALALACLALTSAQASAQAPPVRRGYTIPLLDLAGQVHRQVVVDREPGQYLGHPTTVLLEDGKTILAVYPKGHGKGAIVLKRSTDGGLTWSDRLAVPGNWATSQETPTIHRVVDPQGKRRLILFSGMYPIRMATSEDGGRTWTPLEKIGDFGGIVAMASVERLKDGSYMALFHDDGRYLRGEGKKAKFRVYKTLSRDGGRTWGEPEVIAEHPDADLCEPGLVRSPDGKQIAVLLRENRRKRNSFVITSDDEGKTWTAPRELPGSLTGDRHVGKYAPDGRLFLSFRDTTHESPTKGDWVGWVGTLRGHRGRAGGAVPGPADGQQEGDRLRLPRRGGAAGRDVRLHDLRALGRGGAALHRQRAIPAGGTRRDGEGTPEGRHRDGRHRDRSHTLAGASPPDRPDGHQQPGRRGGRARRRPVAHPADALHERLRHRGHDRLLEHGARSAGAARVDPPGRGRLRRGPAQPRPARRPLPPASGLAAVIKAGQPVAGPKTPVTESIGEGKDTEASNWIIRVVDRPDPRPVWVLIWGGSADLAQALWKVRATRSPDELARFLAKLRVYAIGDQDSTGPWMREQFPGLSTITQRRAYRGMYRGGATALASSAWVKANIHGHGPLGDLYPDYDGGDIWSSTLGQVRGIKEGDTPSFLALVPNGLGDVDHPRLGSWGGRFEGEGERLTDVADTDLETIG